MEKTSERANVTVSIRDMLLYLCSRWRVLLVCLIIGAVLGAAYSGLKSLNVETPVDEAEHATKIYEDMTETDKTNVQNNITTFIHYMNQFEYYSDYNKKSVFQNLNPDTAKVGVLTYYIETGADSTVVDSVIKTYSANLTDDKLAEDVAEAFNVSKEDAFYYYDGVVRVEEGSSTSLYASSTDTDNVPMLIFVYGEDDAFVEKMSGIVKDAVERLGKSLSGNGGIKAITFANETVKKNNDSYIYDRQEYFVTNTKQVLRDISSLRDSLDPDLLTAVEYFIQEQYDGDYLDVVFPDKTIEEVAKPSFNISKKWVLIGAAGLFILAILFIIIKYLVKGVVRCYDDIEYTYGIQVLGTYDDPRTAERSHKLGLDRWIKSLRIKRKTQDRDSSAALIAKKLQLLAANNNVSNICVAAGPEVDTDETFMQDVVSRAEGINVTVASNILRNAESIEKVLEADGVVLLEQMDKSRFSSIDQERVMCAGNNIRILGAIVAE